MDYKYFAPEADKKEILRILGLAEDAVSEAEYTAIYDILTDNGQHIPHYTDSNLDKIFSVFW
ncbi:hypothetical protein AGMMS49573_10470 [Endomicrobiia bacterium]|nr:hypothetical protein AGMMS49573_10470 [Endomicrobiia bacterium]